MMPDALAVDRGGAAGARGIVRDFRSRVGRGIDAVCDFVARHWFAYFVGWIVTVFVLSGVGAEYVALGLFGWGGLWPVLYALGWRRGRRGSGTRVDQRRGLGDPDRRRARGDGELGAGRPPADEGVS